MKTFIIKNKKGLVVMAKINRHIEIVSSTTPGLSSMSRLSRNAVYRVLSRHYSHVGITIVNDPSDLESLVRSAPDLVFLGMKFIHDVSTLEIVTPHKIWLAEYLSARGIAVTGSTPTAYKVESIKSLSKMRVLQAGLKTSDYYVVKKNQLLDQKALPGEYPLFVKPANGGGGAGIDSDSVVRNFTQLKNKVNTIAVTLDSDSLIEKYLPGREFSVAILWDENRAGYSVMPIELIAPKDKNGARLLGSRVKKSDAEKVAELHHDDVRKSVTDLALNAFLSIGGRDYGRIDIRMDEHGVPHFLEANLIPSLIDQYGSFPKACALNRGIGYEEMLLRIVDLGMERTDTATRSLAPDVDRAKSFLPVFS